MHDEDPPTEISHWQTKRKEVTEVSAYAQPVEVPPRQSPRGTRK